MSKGFHLIYTRSWSARPLALPDVCAFWHVLNACPKQPDFDVSDRECPMISALIEKYGHSQLDLGRFLLFMFCSQLDHGQDLTFCVLACANLLLNACLKSAKSIFPDCEYGQ